MSRGARARTPLEGAQEARQGRQLPPAEATTRPRWHNLCMEHDGQLQLYAAVADQLKEAHSRVRA
ncbi:hypothetical protein ACFRLW_29255, partial [Streptomyces sp. NPDC056728]